MKNKILRLVACLLAAATLVTTTVFPVMAQDNAEAPNVVATNDEETADAENTEEPEAGEDTEAPADGEEASEDNSEAPADAEEAPADGEPADDAAAEDEKSKEEDEEPAINFLTDEQEIERCSVAAENDAFILYLDEEFERIGLYVKESGVVHWSNCVNARLDEATSKPKTKENRLSNLGVMWGNATDLVVSQNYYYSYSNSTKNEKTTFELVENGVKVTYEYTKDIKVVIPVYYILSDEYLDVYVNTDEIIEKSGYKEGVKDEESSTDIIVLTEIALNPFMSAATTEETGYILVPDGSGARINLNNGKSNYKNYSQPIYGRDITKVRENQADEVEQVYLPVLAMVKENNGLVMIATEGETFASANAAVAYNKQDQAGYNYCYFSFNLRSTDEYNMAGDSSSIVVFEKGDGKIPVDKIAVRYYPVTSDEEEVTYAEIADVYRNYLIEEEGLAKKTEADYAPMFINYFGGTLKAKSILGIPIDIKTAYTTFEQAVEITSKLKEMGVEDIVVNYNDWTNDSMSQKLDTADSIAGCLGGKGDYKDMLKYFAENGVDYYASIDGFTFTDGGNGFMTLFDTAYRVSKSYSRIYKYNIAYGVPEAGVAPALLAPRSINKLSKKVSKNMAKHKNPGAGLGEISSTLWSDFSNKNHTNRAVTAQYVIDYYKAVKDATGKIIADAPNAYLLPYVDTIKNLPLQSSQFKIADADVPFVQMVLHGYTNYSTKAINGSPDSKTLFLKAVAAGSNIQYDFIYNEATKLVNTDYVGLYYATYEGWLDQAAAEYKLANEILSKVSDSVITGYSQDGSVITTTYENGVVTTVDLETGVITADGKTYNYSDYVDEGGIR